jgi:hypothetical protein
MSHYEWNTRFFIIIKHKFTKTLPEYTIFLGAKLMQKDPICKKFVAKI